MCAKLAVSDAEQERWSMVRTIFSRAFELPREDWDRFLRSESLDECIRDEVRALLLGSDSAAAFFEQLRSEFGITSLFERNLENGRVLSERFRVVRFVARGGMGEVYEAEDLELGGTLALKTMKPTIALREGSLQRFREEIRLARSINHNNVCRIYDVAHDDGEDGTGLVFFTMELLAGRTLSEWLKESGPLSPDEARPLIAQMAEGLDAAHRLGILHRDFKSSNVVVCGEGAETRAVVTDFGLARSLDGWANHGTGFFDGATPAYVAPEQLLREPETPATDFYSMGVVLFEILTGSLPFVGNSGWEIANRRLHENPPRPCSIRPGLPADLDAAILRCLARNPTERFGTGLAVARACGCFAAKRRLTRRVWIPLMAGTAVASATTYFGFRLRPQAKPTLAVFQFATPTPLSAIAEGLADRLADEITQLPQMRVVPRSATRTLLASPSTIAQLKSELQISHFVTGAIQWAGRALHVNVSLVDAGSGVQLWSASFDGDRRDLEAVTRQVARGLIHALAPAMLPVTSLDRKLTTSAEAYEHYLIGRHFIAQRDPRNLSDGIAEFNQAIQYDRTFSAAYASLALGLYWMSSQDGVNRADYIARSKAGARAALELAPASADAHVVLAGCLYAWDWNWREAEDHLRQAIKLAPNLALAHNWYGRVLHLQGRFDEAERELSRALELDPFDRSLGVEFGTMLMDAGRVDEAIAQLQSVARSDRGFEAAFAQLSCAYEVKKNWPEALESAITGVRLSGRRGYALAQLGRIYALTGKKAEGEAILAELKQLALVSQATPMEIATVFAGWHDSEATLQSIERAVVSNDKDLVGLNINPQFHFLSQNPRFMKILQHLNVQP
jgi:eukaryotic-like serine/threonine-protein kinase